LSIFTRKIPAAFLCALTFGAPISAQTTPPPPETTEEKRTLAELPAKDLRRISHYSAQTLEALHEFGSNPEAEGRLAALRSKVQRLTDAGQRSGLTINATAEYFSTYCDENTAAPLPDVFLDAEGRFDAVSLLGSVEIFYNNEAPQAFDSTTTDEADMAAISSVAQPRTPQVPGQNLELAVADVPVIVLETPVIAADAPAGVRAILERVQLRGEDWVITVEQGDSLGLYAEALYGNTLLFQQIFEANLAVLITPNSITVGQELVLPKE